MTEEQRNEILRCIQKECDVVTQEYQKNGKNKNLKLLVLQLASRKKSKLQEKTDLVRIAAELYDEYEGNEEYIHIPDLEQMLQNFKEHVVIGIENTETGELEGVTTIKYYENLDGNINPYYPKEKAKYFEVTGVIIRQREGMVNKGLGTSMYEACFLGLHDYYELHPEENYQMELVIDCTNIKSLYAARNAINNIKRDSLVGEGKKLNLQLGGLYIVKDSETKSLIEAPTFVLESDLSITDISPIDNKEIVFSYQKPQKGNKKDKEYSGLKHSILREVKSRTQNRRKQQERLIGVRAANEILENINNEEYSIKRNLDEGTGYVDFIDLSKAQIKIEDINLRTNGAENIGAKRVPRKDVDKFIGPMPSVVINDEGIEK